MLQQERFYIGREVDFYSKLVSYTQKHDYQKNKKDALPSKEVDDKAASTLMEGIGEEIRRILHPSIVAATPESNVNFLQKLDLKTLLTLDQNTMARITTTPSRATSPTPSRASMNSSGTQLERSGNDNTGKDNNIPQTAELKEFFEAQAKLSEATLECATDILALSRGDKVQPSAYEKVVHNIRNAALAVTCALAVAGISLALKSNNKLLGYVVTPDKLMKGALLLTSSSCLATASTLLDSILVRESEDKLMKTVSSGHKTLEVVEHAFKDYIQKFNLANPGRTASC